MTDQELIKEARRWFMKLSDESHDRKEAWKEDMGYAYNVGEGQWDSDAKTEREYSAKPERLYDFLAANSGANTIIIDEVQRVARLLPIVHAIIFERNNAIQFILTGSSARKIKREGSDLLGGRASKRHLHPFMAAELGDEFSLDSALKMVYYHYFIVKKILKMYCRVT